jgi:hypothetical protein
VCVCVCVKKQGVVDDAKCPESTLEPRTAHLLISILVSVESNVQKAQDNCKPTLNDFLNV